MLKTLIPAVFLFFLCFRGHAQQVDSIYFNLYTDSLKKGTYNYINVEGRYSDGRFLPLTDKELTFTASGGKFTRNSLYIDADFKDPKVTIRTTLIQKPSIWKEIIVYIKTYNDGEKLKTMEEVLKNPSTGPVSERKKKKYKD